jgi:hypothetical protein
MAPSAGEMNFHLHLGYSIVSSSVVVGFMGGRSTRPFRWPSDVMIVKILEKRTPRFTNRLKDKQTLPSCGESCKGL